MQKIKIYEKEKIALYIFFTTFFYEDDIFLHLKKREGSSIPGVFFPSLVGGWSETLSSRAHRASNGFLEHQPRVHQAEGRPAQ